MNTLGRENRFPVSTVKTGCKPFNRSQKSSKGFVIGENPVKTNFNHIDSFEESMELLRNCKIAGWRDYGNGNGGARKAIGWVTKADADLLINEKDDAKRVALFQSLKDVES